jgi:hypothetical protein
VRRLCWPFRREYQHQRPIRQPGRPQHRRNVRHLCQRINTSNYTSAYALLSPHAQTLSSFDAFSQGEASSYIVTLSVSAVTHTGTQDSAEVAFTSVQDPAAGGTGQTCINWSMTYTLIPDGTSWLIDTASPHPGSPAPC